MIPVSEVYQDVQDALLKEANGDINIPLFNRFSKLSELKIIDWITGDIKGNQPPEPYTTQKDKDWAAPFIESFKTHIENGYITRPKNYYGFENMFVIGQSQQPENCEEDNIVIVDKGNTPIELLDGGVFTERCRTYIQELRPSFSKPIAKAIGTRFEFMPKDLGSITLEYYRYPEYAKIIPKLDGDYNEEVPDETASTNYQWDEKTKAVLVWFIVDMFSNRTSNTSMKEFNTITGKTPQGQ